jgi:Flp pilus assembly protein TadD
MPFQRGGAPPETMSPVSTPQSRLSFPGLIPMPACGAALLAVLLYASSLDNPFVYDDYRLIVENPSIQDLSSVLTILARDITRPLVGVSYALDTAIWGTSPFGYHLTNVLLHAVNVVLVYWLALLAASDWRQRGGGAYGFTPQPSVVAVVTSVLTAAHPVMTQAVGYITARSELLYGAFFLGALLAARHWMRAGGWWRSAAVGFWVLSLLSKEAAAMLPLVLWCYDAWLMDGERAARWRRIRTLYAPMLGVVLLFGLGRLAVLATIEYPSGARPDWRYALVSVDAFWKYIGLFVWPTGQTIMHTLPFASRVTLRVVAGVLGLAAFAGVVWSLRRIQGLVSVGLFVTGALILPGTVLFVSGIGEPMAEHRAYLSAIGFFLACGAVAGMAWSRALAYGRGTLVLGATAALFVAQLSGLTLVRNAVWGSSVTLAQEAVLRSPGHWVPRLLLGETLRQNGRCDEAVREYRAVIAMQDQETFTYKKLLGCLLEAGQVPEAERVLHELRRLDPSAPEAAMGLGLLEAARGRRDQSRRYFAEMLARDPQHRDARQYLALLDGSLAGAERSSACRPLLALAPLANPGLAPDTPVPGSPCP